VDSHFKTSFSTTQMKTRWICFKRLKRETPKCSRCLNAPLEEIFTLCTSHKCTYSWRNGFRTYLAHLSQICTVRNLYAMKPIMEILKGEFKKLPSRWCCSLQPSCNKWTTATQRSLAENVFNWPIFSKSCVMVVQCLSLSPGANCTNFLKWPICLAFTGVMDPDA